MENLPEGLPQGRDVMCGEPAGCVCVCVCVCRDVMCGEPAGGVCVCVFQP